MRMVLLIVAGLGLAACDTARDVAYSKAAEIGNKACDENVGDVTNPVLARINNGLRGQGARFTVDGVTCDP